MSISISTTTTGGAAQARPPVIERGPAAPGRQDVPPVKMLGEDRVTLSAAGRARASAYDNLKATSRIAKNDEVVPGSRLHVVG